MLKSLNNSYSLKSGILCIAVLTLSASCKKPTPPPIRFSITGSTDVVLPENGSQTIPLKVIHESGSNEQVTLSVEGLPTGVSVSFTTETSKPEFATTLYLKDDSSKGGIHPVTLRGRSSTGVIMDYPFSLTTLDKTCAKKASGLYNGSTTRRNGSGDVFTNYLFSEDTADINRLLFTVNNRTVYMVLNCNKNLLTIPLQDVGSFKIQGQGYIDQNYSVIDFYYLEKHNSGDTVSCNSRFIKK